MVQLPVNGLATSSTNCSASNFFNFLQLMNIWKIRATLVKSDRQFLLSFLTIYYSVIHNLDWPHAKVYETQNHQIFSTQNFSKCSVIDQYLPLHQEGAF